MRGRINVLTSENTVIGFIGTGVMGKSMAAHLIKAGYKMVVYSRTKEKAKELLDSGAIWANTPKEVAKQAKCHDYNGGLSKRC